MLEKVTIGSATLYHADCREVLPTLPVHDLMLTDPPYGIGINKSHRLATSRGHGGESWDDKRGTAKAGRAKTAAPGARRAHAAAAPP